MQPHRVLPRPLPVIDEERNALPRREQPMKTQHRKPLDGLLRQMDPPCPPKLLNKQPPTAQRLPLQQGLARELIGPQDILVPRRKRVDAGPVDRL